MNEFTNEHWTAEDIDRAAEVTGYDLHGIATAPRETAIQMANACASDMVEVHEDDETFVDWVAASWYCYHVIQIRDQRLGGTGW